MSIPPRVRRPTSRPRSLIGEDATGTLLGTNAIDWGFPLFELIVAFERGRLHFRGLDQEMEVLDSDGEVHEIITPSRETSRWDKYDASFEKSIDAYLDSVRAGLPPPVPGIARPSRAAIRGESQAIDRRAASGGT